MAFPLAAIAGLAGGGGGGAAAGAAGAAANPLAAVSQAAGALSGAFGSLTGSINSIAGPITRFVQAISPAIVAEFNRAMVDLNAAIGIAVLPIMQSLTGVVRELIGSLMPIVTQLQPIIATISQAIADLLVVWIRNWAAQLMNMMPIFKVLADVLVGVTGLVADYMRALRPVTEVMFELGRQLVAFVAKLFGVEGSVEDLFNSIRSVFQMLIKNVVLVAASFLKLVGATDTLNALIKGLKPPEQGPKQGIAVLQNAQLTTDFASIAKKFQASAFQASAFGGKGGPKAAEDWLADLAKTAIDIRDGKGSGLPAALENIMTALGGLKTLMGNMAEVGDATLGVIRDVAALVRRLYDAIPGAKPLEDRLGRLFGPEEERRRNDLNNQRKLLRDGGGTTPPGHRGVHPRDQQ